VKLLHVAYKNAYRIYFTSPVTSVRSVQVTYIIKTF